MQEQKATLTDPMSGDVLCPSFRTIVLADPPPFAADPAGADPCAEFVFPAPPPAAAARGYPVFGRAAAREDEESESDSDPEGLAPASPAPGSFCPWSPEPMQKSRSTGEVSPGPAGKARSAAGGSRLRNLVMGRCRSEGRALFGRGGGKAAEAAADPVAAYRRLYGGGKEEERTRRRRTECYRKDLVGFLPSLRGLRRTFLSF